MRVAVFVLSFCLLAFGAAGCKKKGQTAPPVAGGPGPMAGGPGGWQGGPGGEQPAAEPYTGPFAAGHQVFVSQNCTRCHRGAGQGGGVPGRGRGGRGGPSL